MSTTNYANCQSSWIDWIDFPNLKTKIFTEKLKKKQKRKKKKYWIIILSFTAISIKSRNLKQNPFGLDFGP